MVDSALYDEFLRLWSLKRKDDARAALRRFVDGFADDAERRQWAQGLLANTADDERPHFLVFKELVFPVLLDGYRRNDPWAYRQLARARRHLYSADELHRQVDYATELRLLRRALELEPNDAWTKVQYREKCLDWLGFAIHEWPRGILNGMNFADLSGCEEVLDAVRETRAMTDAPADLAFLAEVEAKVHAYMERLRGAARPDAGEPEPP
jgi:hypothetical protein